MSRTILTYSLVLTASLVASYWAWTRETPASEADSVIVVDIDADELERIEYRSEKLDLDLVQRTDAKGSYLWVTATERKEKRVKKDDPHDDGHGHDLPDLKEEADEEEADGEVDEGADDGEEVEEVEEEEPEIEYDIKVKEFKAGKNGDDLLESLNPLEADRALDTVPEDKLEELGLTDPEATVTLHRKGKDPKVLQLGGEAYGTKDRYLRDVSTNRIYLVDDDFVRPLKYGNTRLPDRELFGFEVPEMEKLTIQGATQSVDLEQHNRDDEEAAFWALVGSDEPADVAETWLDKVLRLKSAAYIQVDETPVATELAFTLTITGLEGESVSFEVLSGENPDGEETWYGRSTYTRELVRLHKGPASQAAEDLVTVFEG